LLNQLLQDISPQELKFFNPHPFDIPTFEKLLQYNHYKAWGIIENDQLIAYVFIRCIARNICYAGYYVHSDSRGKGYSKRMFQELLKFTKANKLRLRTSVSPNNKPSFNTSKNFTQLGTRKNGDWILEHE
jgi:RimJ/RimL family protein N-acetyltransferase